MEFTVPYLDNILRNPNRFIINEEEIVKIELARKIKFVRMVDADMSVFKKRVK